MKRSQIIHIVKTYGLISLGLLIFVLGWTAFLIPSKITAGGIAGVGTLVFYATGFPVGYTNLIINSILVVVALKILGAKFGFNTIYGILITSLLFIVLQKYITEPLVKDQFMSVLIGSGIAGVGLGIAFTNGGNSGGTDIIALIVNKFYNISPGRVFMYFDLLIIASGYFVFHSVEKIVYGYVSMAVFAYVIDLWLNGNRQSFQIMIFSKKSKEIARRISEEIGRGVTCLNGYGWYTKKETEVVIVIARKFDKNNIMHIIKETDPESFISVAKVMGVFGQNFEEIKL